MNKIEFPRQGYKGETTKTYIHKKYLECKIYRGNGRGRKKTELPAFDYKRLKSELANISTPDPIANRIIRIVKKITCKQLIIGKPDVLRNYIAKFSRRELDYIEENTDFKNKILGVFNYDAIRDGVLRDIGQMLNIKTCPYCNMAYTLYIESKEGSGKKNKFQFDHFYPQSRYPFLAISLYNLVPSCSQCNHAKNAGATSLYIHPYHSNIHQLFRFRIASPTPPHDSDWKNLSMLRMMIGMAPEVGDLNIVLQPTSTNKAMQDALSELDGFARLTDQYNRHMDIVQEIYAKRYLKPYYDNPKNFKGMGVTINPMRLLLGVYTDKKDIEKRPLTKFIQDIWDQAIGKR